MIQKINSFFRNNFKHSLEATAISVIAFPVLSILYTHLTSNDNTVRGASGLEFLAVFFIWPLFLVPSIIYSWLLRNNRKYSNTWFIAGLTTASVILTIIVF